MRALRDGICWSGLLAGPLAWSISTQLNYALVEWQCRNKVPIIPSMALLLSVFAAAGGALSWRAFRENGAAFQPEREIEIRRFVAILGTLVAALFGFVILVQGAAALILDECIR